MVEICSSWPLRSSYQLTISNSHSIECVQVILKEQCNETFELLESNLFMAMYHLFRNYHLHMLTKSVFNWVCKEASTLLELDSNALLYFNGLQNGSDIRFC